METTFKMTAYHKWLLHVSGGHRETLGYLIHLDLMEQNPQAWDLWEDTDSNDFSKEGILKIVDYLIENINIER